MNIQGGTQLTPSFLIRTERDGVCVALLESSMKGRGERRIPTPRRQKREHMRLTIDRDVGEALGVVSIRIPDTDGGLC